MLPDSSDCRLTSSEQHDLAIRVMAGDQSARETMIVTNLGLVRKIARRYFCSGAVLEDLIQEGTRGLICAVDRFDPKTHGVRFSTYADYWIRNTISKSVVANSSLVRVPEYLFRLKCRRMGDGPVPDDGESTEIGNPVEISDRRRRLLKQSMISQTSYFAIDDNGEESTLEETIVDDYHADDDLETGEKIEELRKALDLLTPLERLIIFYHFGLSDDSEKMMSYRQIAKMIRMPFSRVQTAGSLGMKKLRMFFRDQGLAVDSGSRCGV